MIATVERRLRWSWHQLRQRAGLDVRAPTRLIVRKATWLDDARSPVVLMIDDLTNAWHNRAGGERWEPGGDWGGGHRSEGSALQHLDDRLLQSFPEAKVTFFVVAGPISGYTTAHPFSFAASLDVDAPSRDFFRSLAADPRFELAYHGFNHGTPSDRLDQFVQEFRGFGSVEAGIEQTRRGLETFRRATGAVPLGGKYGGWDYNELGDRVVEASGFLWWCRDWTPRDVSGRVSDPYYDAQFFGRDLVVALPSTVHGHFWSRHQVDQLIARRQVIAIEEHIATVRPDGGTQAPNIVDDMDDLCRMYAYLRGRSVWHATATEVASYVAAREQTLVYDVTRDGFSIQYAGRFQRPALTLIVDCSAVCGPDRPLIDVITPDGCALEATACRYDRKRYQHRITIPVLDGRYLVRSIADTGAR